MPDSLTALEVDRSKLLQEFLGLGDLRPGSIGAVVAPLRQTYLPFAPTPMILAMIPSSGSRVGWLARPSPNPSLARRLCARPSRKLPSSIAFRNSARG